MDYNQIRKENKMKKEHRIVPHDQIKIGPIELIDSEPYRDGFLLVDGVYVVVRENAEGMQYLSEERE